jgi:hypothetical protein
MAAPPNKYGVHNRLALLENAVTELRNENAALRTHLAGKLETLVNDAKNIIQDSIRIPQDGAPGKDGRDGVDGQSIVGPRGEAGGVTVIPESEMAQAVVAMRRKLKERHAAVIAALVEHAEGHKKGTWVGQHFAKLLENIRQEIELL